MMIRALSITGLCLLTAGRALPQTTLVQTQDLVMTSPHSKPPTHTNRLAQEKSPYLLQHAHNPVDWHPWGEEAFARARQENKPIFLSIGYSTCHWCHVMERESFEDEVVGAFLNQHFISIKVDREERPDIDKIYMTFVQATTGSGGWPMNVFLTPDLKPFYGGTYFPPQPAHGRPSFMELLQRVSELWSARHTEVIANANQTHAQLSRALTLTAGAVEQKLDVDLIRAGADALKRSYDPRHGGFGSAPKFPQPCQPLLLLRHALRFDDSEARQMVLDTCDHMAAGGIYDQLGGGFARYAVDAEWLVPHFEKMLYDNAQLLELYLRAYVVTRNERHAETARGIVRYILRDMTHPDGGFYSAEDADSEGHEGKFYCWTQDELQTLLNQEEYDLVVRYFGITEKGNFLDHSHPDPLPGQNVLHVAQSNLSPGEQDLLDRARAKMVRQRSTRVRPHRDDKVLTSWNGLMLGGLAQAAAILGDQNALAGAEKNVTFIRSHLWEEQTKTLHHRWRDGERDTTQLLEDYALFLEGLIHLYETTLTPEYLQFAIHLADSLIERFYDKETGGFWQSTPSNPGLILRLKDDYDGAEPSGNSVAVLALLRLAALTDNADYKEAATTTLAFFRSRLEQSPLALPRMLCAVDFALQEPLRIVITGDPSSPKGQALLRAAHSIHTPNRVILGTSAPVEPFARSLASNAPPQAYLCTGTACQEPTSNPDELRQRLQ